MDKEDDRHQLLSEKNESTEKEPGTIRLDKNYYFRDGIRKIDYVLVWEEPRYEINPDDVIRKRMNDHRKRFQEKLCKTGVEIEEESEESEKLLINFVKIHIPFSLMCRYAENLEFFVPLPDDIKMEKEEENGTKKDKDIVKNVKEVNKLENTEERQVEDVEEAEHIDETEKDKDADEEKGIDIDFQDFELEDAMNALSEKIPVRIPFIMENTPPYIPNQCNTAVFTLDKIEKYIGYENEDTFFSTTQRHVVAQEILVTLLYGRQSNAEIGIERMIQEQVYAAAFPIHEGPCHVSADKPPNRRQILLEYWAKWSKFYKYQPLDNIREYYGEQIAFYFAWLGYYTTWLLPATVVGILVMICGVGTMFSYVPSIEICNSRDTYIMCPICNFKRGCPYWNLSTICFDSKATYLFDHPGTVFFAVFMAVWAVLFLKSWKRKNAQLAFRWDVLDYEEEDDYLRPEYQVFAPDRKVNPVTGIEEPYFPENERYKRIATAFGSIIIMIIVVLIFLIGIIIYRILIAIPLFENPKLRSKALVFASLSSSFINLILIMSLSKIYERLALKLTMWEMHRTKTEFENHLTFKVYLFEFVNFYSSIFYIAFFKGKFTGYPGNYNLFFGLRSEECSNGSCLFELAQQLAILMIGKQVINNIQEIFVPKVHAWFRLYTKGLQTTSSLPDSDSELTFWGEDYKLLPYEGLFEEYMEMVIQFGFITIFVAAFPLAPLFALLNNWLEIRLDASKLVLYTRRPISQRARDIGIWYTILDIIVKLSIISNAFVIAFTSDFIPKEMYRYSHNNSLVGYVNFTLAWAPNNSYSQPCRYLAFRDGNGKYTKFYWRLLALRLAFVVLFEHIVFGIAMIIEIVIPDISERLHIDKKRKNFINKKILNYVEEKKKGSGKKIAPKVASNSPHPNGT